MTTSESKGRFFYKTNRFELIRITNRIESIRIANWNALDVSSAARRIAKCGMRNLRPSCDYHHVAVVSGLFTGSTSVTVT